MPFIDIDGQPVHYARSGGNSRTPPLLMIHGAYDHLALWDGCRSRLPDLDCVAVDLPGHGGSGGNAIETDAGYRDFFARLIPALALDAPVLCGHSLGGSICLGVALDGRVSLSGICLIGSAPFWGISDPDISQWEGDRERAFADNDRHMFSDATSPELRLAYGRQLREASSQSCRADMMACRSYDLEDQLARIDLPALILFGDAEFWKEGSVKLARGLSGSRAAEIAGAGHAVLVEQPEACAGHIGAFAAEIQTCGN